MCLRVHSWYIKMMAKTLLVPSQWHAEHPLLLDLIRSMCKTTESGYVMSNMSQKLLYNL